MEINFKYLSSLSKKEIKEIEELFLNERLLKHLWIEFLLNPELVNALLPYSHNPEIKTSLEDALSWYLAFRWLLPENRPLERLYKEQRLTPYKVRLRIYREKIREFIKGLVYAGLC
ncbi:MAG: hypothetical protein ACK4Z9_08560 [Thermodesulfovibrionales bacterium]